MIAEAEFRAAAAERILVFDGGYGTAIQKHGLSEADYRGSLPLEKDQKGNNDLLCLTRPDIVEGIRALLTRPLAAVPAIDDWAEAVRQWATAYRDAFAAHPAAIPMLVSQTVSHPETLAQYDRLAEILEQQAGLRGDDLLVALDQMKNRLDNDIIDPATLITAGASG